MKSTCVGGDKTLYIGNNDNIIIRRREGKKTTPVSNGAE